MALAVLCGTGCPDWLGNGSDAGADGPDAAGRMDASAADAGRRDAGRADAGRVDAGRPDASARDAAEAADAAEWPDAAEPADAAQDLDAGVDQDAGTAVPDAGGADAGQPDAWMPPRFLRISGAAEIAAGACEPFQLEVVDGDGTPVTLDQMVLLAFTPPPGLAFHDTASCAPDSETIGMAMPRGVSAVEVSVRAVLPGSYQAQVEAPALAAVGRFSVTVVPAGGYGAELAALGPDMVTLGACAPLEVLLLDTDGLEVTDPRRLPGRDVPLELSVEGGVSAWPDATCQGTEPAVLRAGTARAQVAVRGEAAGQGTVRVGGLSLLRGRFTLTVAPAAAVADPRGSALVVYNVNAPGSRQVAEHYAQARGLAAAQLCPVPLPPGTVATGAQLLAARKLIVESCVCPLIPAAQRPAPCAVGNLDAVALVSPITHLVLARGVPTRLTGTGWYDDGMSPSLGFYLGALLYTDAPVLGDPMRRLQEPSYPTVVPRIVYPGPLSAATARWATHGYLAAGTVEGTLALIDRTVAAEAQGFSGAILTEEDGTSDHVGFLADLAAAYAPECAAYQSCSPFVFGDASCDWPSLTCRWGTTASSTAAKPGAVPGELGSTISYPVGVGLFLGGVTQGNTSVAFDGFDTLRRWHRALGPCTELCANLGAPEREACQERSQDVFRELNSECVGGAPGFLANQQVSGAVQYMGFLPAGWSGADGLDVEKAGARVLETGGYQDVHFTDTRFARFGMADPEDPTPECPVTAGGTQPCPERVVLSLSRALTLTPALEFPAINPIVFTFQVRYRNAASPGGKLLLNAVFRAGTSQRKVSAAIALDEAHPEWATATVNPQIASSQLGYARSLKDVTVQLEVSPDAPALGWLDLDGVEFLELQGGTSLLDAAVGSFAVTGHGENAVGDLAANVIDRMGGVAAWGNASAFAGATASFGATEVFAPMFFAGRTLGESLLGAGSAASGLIFGDPLYRPVAIRLRTPRGPSHVSATAATLEANKQVLVTAMVGTAHLDSTEWTVAVCRSWDPARCSTTGPETWQQQLHAVGAVDGLALDWTEWLNPGTEPLQATLRLQAWAPGHPEQPLTSNLFVDYQP